MEIVPREEGRFGIEERDSWLAYLDEHGYVVLKNVASPLEVTKGISLLWDFMESFPGTELKRDQIETWRSPNWFPSPTNGIANGFGFGQSRFLWHARLLPKVEEAFKAIWGDVDLLVSFDGGNVFRPHAYEPQWRTKGGWWHVDQNSKNPLGNGKVCIQGLVSYFDADASTGGLCVIPGSHKRHDEVCGRCAPSNAGPDASDFVMIPDDDVVHSGGHILVCCRAGDMILWDSRTVHCNCPSFPFKESEVKSEPAGGWNIIRACAYICMTPAAWASEEVLRKRREAFVFNESTSHWPHRFFSAGGRSSSFWIPQNEPFSASAKQRQLIGFPSELSWSEHLSRVTSWFVPSAWRSARSDPLNIP